MIFRIQRQFKSCCKVMWRSQHGCAAALSYISMIQNTNNAPLFVAVWHGLPSFTGLLKCPESGQDPHNRLILHAYHPTVLAIWKHWDYSINGSKINNCAPSINYKTLKQQVDKSHTSTHTHKTVLRLSGFCPRHPGWAGTRRNIRGHQSSLICFLHLLQSMASSLFNLHAWQSLSTIKFFWFTSWPGNFSVRFTLYWIPFPFVNW